ncbi:MAG: hypothetical protein ACK4YT_13545, partial [Sphingomonas sp.]
QQLASRSQSPRMRKHAAMGRITVGSWDDLQGQPPPLAHHSPAQQPQERRVEGQRCLTHWLSRSLRAVQVSLQRAAGHLPVVDEAPTGCGEQGDGSGGVPGLGQRAKHGSCAPLVVVL